MHRRVRGVVGSGMASVASMAQHGPVGDQGTPVSSQHESMQRHRSDDMGLKDARASESDKADYPMKEAPCGASHRTPSGETIGTGTGKQPEQILRLRQHPRAKAALCLAAQRGNCWLQRYAATRCNVIPPPVSSETRHPVQSNPAIGRQVRFWSCTLPKGVANAILAEISPGAEANRSKLLKRRHYGQFDLQAADTRSGTVQAWRSHINSDWPPSSRP